MGQTIESSSAVRLIEVKEAVAIDAGMGASGGKRQTAKAYGRRRNFRRMNVVSPDSKPRRASLGLDGSLRLRSGQAPTRPHMVSGDVYGFLHCSFRKQAG